MKNKDSVAVRPGWRVIFRQTIRLKNGRLIRASAYQKKAFAIQVRD